MKEGSEKRCGGKRCIRVGRRERSNEPIVAFLFDDWKADVELLLEFKMA